MRYAILAIGGTAAQGRACVTQIGPSVTHPRCTTLRVLLRSKLGFRRRSERVFLNLVLAGLNALTSPRHRLERPSLWWGTVRFLLRNIPAMM
jgi:hypothetical protein